MPVQYPQIPAMGPSHTRPRLELAGLSGQAFTSPSHNSMLETSTGVPETFEAIKPTPVEFVNHGYTRVVMMASSFACTSKIELSTTMVKFRRRTSLSRVFQSGNLAASVCVPSAVPISNSVAKLQHGAKSYSQEGTRLLCSRLTVRFCETGSYLEMPRDEHDSRTS